MTSRRNPAFQIALLAVLAASPPALAATGPRAAPPRAAPARSAPEPPPFGGFRVAVEEAGVYAIRFEDLVEAGLGAAFLRSSALAATRDGEPVPIWVEDGGDGRFGPGDHVELVAGRPAGEHTWHHPYSTEAVYLLGVSRRPSPRLRPGALEVAPAGSSGAAAGLLARRHLEEDRLFLRFPGESAETSELWFWARLTPLDDEPLALALDLADLDPAAPEPMTLRLGMRGWSRLVEPLAEGLADHRLEIGLGGRPLGTAEWDNRAGGFAFEPPALAAGSLAPGEHELTLRISPRSLPGGDPVVDVVALDWIEVDYPRRPRVGRAQGRFEVGGGDESAGAAVRLAAPAAGLTLYTDAGERLSGAAAPGGGGQDGGPGDRGAARARYAPPAGARLGGGFWAVPAGGLRRPASIRPIRGDGLRDRDRRADYLIVVHPRLRWQVEPLAGAHRRRGLAVEVVETSAIYDQFGGGIEHPRAIRDFLSYARESWRRPASRFALLVGDASWDAKSVSAERVRYADRPYRPGRGAVIGSSRVPTYSERAAHNYRGLVPTGSSATLEGHAASDARLAMLDGDRWPDLAIGRLPAATPGEAAAMVAKTLDYLERPRVGPWRRDVLWVSDGAPHLDGATDRLARSLAGRGFAGDKVRPEPADADPAARRERLIAAIDRGPLVVHFIGHGGRNIWRTGQSSELAQSDLFTLDDLDRLSPADRLPVVLSMSCYSAPFDHPNADSIGEKFLRLAGRGAVAVVAASWRNVPTETMSRMLTDELMRPGATIGEALLRAKRRNHSTEFIEQYNLLGDPALPLQVPGPLAVRQATPLDGRGPAVIADLRALGFHGRALVDWRDRAGELLERQELDAAGPHLLAAFPGDAGTAARLGWAQVYVWNTDRGLDALGAIEIHPPPPPARIAGRTERRTEPTPAEIPR